MTHGWKPGTYLIINRPYGAVESVPCKEHEAAKRSADIAKVGGGTVNILEVE